MRLIDADALIEHFTLWLDDDEHYVERTFKAVAEDDIIPIIDKAPTIEAEPVKHGKWIETKVWGGRNFYCSECRFSFIVDTCMLKPMWNYCPNCGAKMENPE